MTDRRTDATGSREPGRRGRPRPSSRSRRRPGPVTSTVAGILVSTGGVLLVGSLGAPQAVERAYGAIRTPITGTVAVMREEVLGELPAVGLGVTGGVVELDACDGTFTEMDSYERDGVPPVWAAHNHCRGDVLLPWETGQRVQVTGSDQVYEVVDIRFTPKTWATTDDLVGLGGSLALQTCLYGEDRMKFVGLEPVA